MPSEYKKEAKKLLTLAKGHEKKYRKMIQLAGREKTPQNTIRTLDRAQIEKREALKLELRAIQMLKKDAGDKLGKAITKPRKIRTRL
jgi:hypothetical protein